MQVRMEQEILSHLDESPNNFKLFLERITDDPLTLKTLVKIMQKKNNLQTDQKLATSINFIIEQRFKKNDKNPELWIHYFNEVASNTNIDWKIAKIFQRSLTTFMESFEEQFDIVMKQSYPKFANHHWIMAATAIINGCEFTSETRFGFIQKSLSDYIKLGDRILKECTDILENNQDENIIIGYLSDYALEYLLSVKEIIYFLRINSVPGSNWQELLTEASTDRNLFEILKGFMDIGKKSSNYFTLDGSLIKQQAYNNIKSVALQIYIEILSRYHKSSTVQQFDSYPVLSFLEQQLPKLVEQISAIKTKVLQLDCNSILCMAIIKFIRKGTEFTFMHNYFWDNYRFIYWKIVYPLLKINDEEIRQYNDDPQGFIRQAESLVQQFQGSDNSIKNCKTQAALLMQSFAEYIDGALSYITQQTLLSLQNLLTNNSIRCQGHTKYQASITIQESFTILSILTSKITNNRKDLLFKIRQLFKNLEEDMLSLNDIDRSRLFIYLTYTFDDIFANPEDGKKYFYLASDTLSMKETSIKCALSFFKEYRHLDIAIIVWDILLNLIRTTQYSDLLKIVADITKIKILDFSHEVLINILNKSMQRIKNDFDYQIKQSRVHNQGEVINQSCTLQCLRIIRYIAKNCKNREGTSQICGSIWSLFDLMSGFSIIEYDDEIIQIFNIMIKTAENQIGEQYFQFLGNFKDYHIKQKSIGQLYETYILMITRGSNYLLSSQGRQAFVKIIVNILVVIDFCIQQTIPKALLLLQYLLVKFPQELNHEELFHRTYESFQLIFKISESNYEILKDTKYKKIVGNFINLWILGSVISQPIYNKGQQLLVNCTNNAFKDFNGKIFAYAIKTKIKILSQNKKLDKIIYYLILGIRLLDFRGQHLQKKASDSESLLVIFNERDVFQQLRQCFKICKNQLNSNDYEYLMKQIEKQIPLISLKQLLSKSSINQEPRKIIKIHTS